MGIRAGWSKAFYKDSKTGETVAYYYDTDGKTSRLPPPPPLSDDEDDSDGSSLAPETSRRKSRIDPPIFSACGESLLHSKPNVDRSANSCAQ